MYSYIYHSLHLRIHLYSYLFIYPLFIYLSIRLSIIYLYQNKRISFWITQTQLPICITILQRIYNTIPRRPTTFCKNVRNIFILLIALDADTLPPMAEVSTISVGIIPRVLLASVMTPGEVVVAGSEGKVHLGF